MRVANDGVTIPWSTKIGNGVLIRATDGATLCFGERCVICANAFINVQGGAVTIAHDVYIGRGCNIASKDSIHIGAGTLIAEYVTIKDQDHRTNVSTPILNSGFDCSPISIDSDVWIGAKASVLRGATIGRGAVIGAHALVKGRIPANAIAVGVPARVKRFRQLDSHKP